MNQSQKQFKEFATLWRYNLAQDDSGFYVDSLTQRAWDSWCASRAALVVELPKPRELEFTSIVNPYTAEVSLYQGEFYDVYEIKQAIDAAGVKYK